MFQQIETQPYIVISSSQAPNPIIAARLPVVQIGNIYVKGVVVSGKLTEIFSLHVSYLENTKGIWQIDMSPSVCILAT